VSVLFLLIIKNFLIQKIISRNFIGHETYKVDTDVYKKIIETFGEEIINPADKSIDRKILGKKVFQSPDELKKLTDIVWPAILNLAQERIDHLFKEGSQINCFHNIVLSQLLLGKRVIVLDAAVLLEAKWTVAVNEIWIASIPPKEVLTFFSLFHFNIYLLINSFAFVSGYSTCCRTRSYTTG